MHIRQKSLEIPLLVEGLAGIVQEQAVGTTRPRKPTRLCASRKCARISAFACRRLRDRACVRVQHTHASACVRICMRKRACT
eukprot:5748847-Pleurochrysis_carterae.AAC.1